MHDNPVALVTGGNRGIGLQIAKDLAARGLTVVVGARTLAAGQAAAATFGGRAVQLDVTDAASIAAAARSLGAEFGRLDVLVNNAGIARTARDATPLMEVVAASRPSVASLAEMRAVFETNVFGVVAVTQGLLPLLRTSPAGRIVNVSSSAGSLALNADPACAFRDVFGAIYAPSKAALNGVTIAMAIEFEPLGIKVNAMCPGFARTEFNGYAGHVPVEQASRRAVELALLGPDGPSGTFSNGDGPVPW